MKINILDLKPTQFAVGMLEVDEKLKEIQKLKKPELKKFVKENPVPVVLSPEGEIFIVDKHHFLCICYQMGIDKVKINVIHDLTGKKMSYPSFWKWMTQSRNMYPFCQFGEGPREALYLPRDIRGLADDPYRSLAWFVRKAGAFENSEKNFAEFRWANFFRSKKLLDKHGPRGLAAALPKAVKLAQSAAAKDLPGFDKLNLKQQKKTVIRAQKKAQEVLKA